MMPLLRLPMIFIVLVCGCLIGCLNSATPEPNSTIKLEPNTVTLWTGFKQTFTATMQGTSDPSVVWDVDGSPLTGTGNELAWTAPSVPGNYTVRVKSKLHPEKTATTIVEVSPAEFVTSETISAGGAHSLAVKSDGTLWAWGQYQYGAINDGAFEKPPSAPKQIMAGVLSVSAGRTHSLVVKSDGTLWAWGDNSAGQLGDGTATTSVIPRQVMTGVSSASAGGGFSLALKSDGTVWAWGSNDSGQLCIPTAAGNSTFSSTPAQVLTGVASISAGGGHALALKLDGTLWTWGANENGQLGDGTDTRSYAPKQILSGVSSISASGNRSLAVKVDGTLWAWGENTGGQLGDGTTTHSNLPKQILSGVLNASISFSFSLAVKTDGTLWAWGDSSYGWLGDFSVTPKQIMTGVTNASAGDRHLLVLKSDGTLWTWGDNFRGQLGEITSVSISPKQVLSGVSKVNTEGGISLAVKSDGTLWTWGDGPVTPKQLMEGVSSAGVGAAVKQDKTLWTWGGWSFDATTGVYSYDTTNIKQLMKGVSSVSTGHTDSFGYSMAVKLDGTLWTWGSNYGGHLGDGTFIDSPTPKQIMSGVSSVSAGGNALALKSDGTLWTWGTNVDYLGGLVSDFDWLKPKQIMSGVSSMSAGELQSMAVKSDGTLWVWKNTGNNYTNTPLSTPKQIMTGVSNVGAGVSNFSVDDDHFLVVKSDGTLWAWGNNHYGQLGDGTTKSSSSTPKQIMTGVSGSASSIGVGHYFSLAVKSDGTLWAWGNNYRGQLGDGTSSYIRTPKQVLTGIKVPQ